MDSWYEKRCTDCGQPTFPGDPLGPGLFSICKICFRKYLDTFIPFDLGEALRMSRDGRL
jgi:hypothetical protein